MKYTFIKLIVCLSLMVSCDTDKKVDPFEIRKHHVGQLTDSTEVSELKTIFANDSIVSAIKGDEFLGENNDIEIFDKEGNKLLVLTPSQALDSTAVVKTIQIMDGRYKTAKNISTASTFGDIKNNYKISKVNNLINSIVVSVNEINAAFTIDKKELPSNLRYGDMDMIIDPVQIPDQAKIKYFMLNWQ